jgi:hypothetical protein
MEDFYFNPDKFVVRSISKTVAKDLIIKNHYTHKWTMCQVAYGLFFKEDDKNEFIEGNFEKIVGVCVYGSPVGRSAADSFCSLVKNDEVFELTRLWVEDGYGRNVESWFISQTFKLLKKEYNHIKIVLSYSDEEQGHKGIIYQATGFYYQGNKGIALMPNFSVSLTGPPNYKWIHSRTVQSTYGSHNVEYLKKKIGHTFWRKKESTKHRYFYILTNKVEKKKILTNLKHPCLSYPKDTKFEEEIEEIKVETVRENPFFT